MAKKKQQNPLIGAQTQPVVLDDTTKIDIDVAKKFVDNIINAGLSNTLDSAALEKFTSISNSRDRLYQLIDVMAKDSKVSSILKTLSSEVCEVADNGHIVWCESKDPKISKFVNYLLNVMNVDKNIFAWTYCLLKYGDVYLRLYRESDYKDNLFKKNNIKNAYSARNVLNEKLREELAEFDKKKALKENIKLNVHKTYDKYSFYVEMIADPGTMFELTKYGITQGYIEVPNSTLNNAIAATLDATDTTNANTSIFGNAYRLKTNDINIYQADDFVHGCLDDNYTRFPEQVQLFTNAKDYENADSTGYMYNVKRGKSLLIDSYKVWRELALLEDSVLLNRVTKSSIIRNVSVEVGDMPKEQVSQTLRRVKEMMEQKSGINVNNSMSEYTNPGPIENNIYTATHDGKGAITVNAVGGDINVRDIADVDWWNDKFYSAYGIPKQYFGFTSDSTGFNGGTSLSIISSVFAKSVKRVQNADIQMLTDAINLILYNRGLKTYMNNFVLKMKAPLSQEELDYRANLTERISAISNLQAALADVEDKGRRLTILKSLLGTLNYGDDILTEIDKEISEANKLKKQAEEEAKAKEEEKKAEELDLDLDLGPAPSKSKAKKPAKKEKEEKKDELDLDLGNSNIAAESFTKDLNKPSLKEDDEFKKLTEDPDSLPTPAEIDKDKDFSDKE